MNITESRIWILQDEGRPVTDWARPWAQWNEKCQTAVSDSLGQAGFKTRKIDSLDQAFGRAAVSSPVTDRLLGPGLAADGMKSAQRQPVCCLAAMEL